MGAESVQHLAEAIERMPLVDHHVHGMLPDPSEAALLAALTQAGHAAPPADVFDSAQGFALRRHCAPILGLAPFASPADYLAARRALEADEVARRLLRASGIAAYLVDDGHRPDLLMSDERMARLAAAPIHRVARLETIAEAVLAQCASGAEFVERLGPALDAAAAEAVAFKTVAAHRCGLELDPARPTNVDVRSAADAWFAEWRAHEASVGPAGSVDDAPHGGHAASVDDAPHAGHAASARPRLTDPTITRHLIWWALERGAVLQVHAGFGDADLVLEGSNPARMQALVAATAGTGGRIAFLHCYPYVREAGWLAHVFPHVFLDVGLAVGFLGANADSVVRESLDLAPFSRVLFSTDAWGVPERVLLGARLWRDAAGRVLGGYVTAHGWPVDEATRVAEGIAWRNAERVYRRRFVSR
ncbi:amidohydrolase [Agromyces bracchium]|uniref:Amidohydrolase n=1 Tax=Agromyces bracchium TaxID=88376 RepID=A0A6I3MFJ9_9MICO|nr:amidohydrolase [Agromyces bracchium]MTH70136.1 amidohydrolase [Agromyces bracchium]